jgi:hypothetical protein
MLLPIFQTCCGITRGLHCQPDINLHRMKVKFRSITLLFSFIYGGVTHESRRYERIHFGVARISLNPPPLHPTAIEGAWTSPFRGKRAELFRLGLDQIAARSSTQTLCQLSRVRAWENLDWWTRPLNSFSRFLSVLDPNRMVGALPVSIFGRLICYCRLPKGGYSPAAILSDPR